MRNSANRGTSSAVAGTISATSERDHHDAGHAARGSRASAKPASDATSTLTGTATAATSSELTRGPDQPAELDAPRVALRSRAGRARARGVGGGGRPGWRSEPATSSSSGGTNTSDDERPRRARARPAPTRVGYGEGPRARPLTSRSDAHQSLQVEPPGAQAVRRGVQDPRARHDRQAGHLDVGHARRGLGPGRRAAGAAAARRSRWRRTGRRSASSRTRSVTGRSPRS